MMKETDINRVAKQFKIERAMLKAVIAVESDKKGFINGVPKILFERHIFYQRLKRAGFNVHELELNYPAICNSVAGGYIGGIAEHTRLNNAKKINEVIAIESCSWGLFQIMGFHWRLMRYDSAQQYESKMRESLTQHIDAFCRFISMKSNRAMLTALQNKDFSVFARLYNGSHYAKNKYDIKLETAYEFFARNLKKP